MTFLPRLILSFSALALVSQARGQVGNDNPTGPTGIFNGNITTGCSYDPYTGNAMRKVTDITIAGAVGSYGLSYSRFYNSRNVLPTWQGSYAWTVGDSNEELGTLPPTSYTVGFPDGRYEIFQPSSTLNDGYYHAGPGVAERFQPLNTSTNPMYAYLLLADGGKVKFQGSLNTDRQYNDNGTWTTYYYYTFVAQAIIDPYGQPTTLTYNTDGTMQKVTEPAGRYISFSYTTISGGLYLS